MRHLMIAFGLAVFVVGVGVGCGKKPDPEPEVKAETQPAPPDKAKPAPTPNPEPKPKPKPKPGPAPKPGPSAKQPDVIFGGYNEFNAKNQLRNLFFALSSFELTHKHYPAGIVGPDGNLGLSWRVAILPYMDDEAAKLYKEFKLAEAWDSPHNKKLLTRMPKLFATPGTAAAQGKTYLRTFAGPKAFIPLPAAGQVGQPARGRAAPRSPTAKRTRSRSWRRTNRWSGPNPTNSCSAMTRPPARSRNSVCSRRDSSA